MHSVLSKEKDTAREYKTRHTIIIITIVSHGVVGFLLLLGRDHGRRSGDAVTEDLQVLPPLSFVTVGSELELELHKTKTPHNSKESEI